MGASTSSMHRWIVTILFFYSCCLSSVLSAQDASTDVPPAKAPAPINIKDAGKITIQAIAETGYFDEQGRYVVDLLEQDYAYLAVRVETLEGRPVEGALPSFSLEGASRLVLPEALSENPGTDEFGVIEFAVTGGSMGLDKVTVELRETRLELLVNVISLRATGFPALEVVEGGIPWTDLMKARVQYTDTAMVTEFPKEIETRAGQTVKLSGFMMPLEADLKQRRFLLTSNPPGCYFHIPGGPAGAVEVFATEGIEASWNPLVLEGRFEPQKESETGVVYQLHDARLISP